MPGSKGLSPHELAHRWVKDLRTRPDMSIKVGDFCPRHHIIGKAGKIADDRRKKKSNRAYTGMWNADHVGSNFCIDKSIVEIFPSCGNPVHKSGTCIFGIVDFLPAPSKSCR